MKIQILPHVLVLSIALTFTLMSPSRSRADTLEDLDRRLDRLEQENRELRQALIAAIGQAKTEGLPAPTVSEPAPKPDIATGPKEGVVRFDSSYAFAALDPTVAGKTKPLMQLGLGDGSPAVYLSGALTAVADFQTSNRGDDFGYLMRQPGANHIGKTASEVALHTAQLAVTTRLSPWVSAYGELLYDPQQSFASGTITALSRNQIQLRRGYVLIGNPKATPFYFMAGKLDSPFGQTDTLSPFSLSTDVHTFAGLSYGALVGFSRGGLNLSLEAAQGGAEFRGLNTPVSGTNVPSQLNNFIVDANYSLPLGQPNGRLLVGASYEAGSPYCQTFPIQHFGPCEKANPAFAVYTTLGWNAVTLKGEFMQTVGVWPGTHNPNPPLNAFAASKVTSYDLAGRYRLPVGGKTVDLSLSFSSFLSGPTNAPWRGQDQFVGGLAIYLEPNVKLFSELVLVNGYDPLNFLSGGIPGQNPGVSDSDPSNRSKVIMSGVNVAF